MNKYVSYIKNNSERFIAELIGLIQIKSVGIDGTHKVDMHKCAKRVAYEIKQAGLKEVKIYSTKGHPIVYAERIESSRLATILIYGHYDVQPPGTLNSWKTPAFNPIIKNNLLFGRGTADDKGQFYAHIKAIETILKLDHMLPINIKILIEGEEEIGSPNLRFFLKKHKEMLRADYIVISDTSMLDKNHPAICYGLRGIASAEIEVTGPKTDIHSGSWGGITPNPAIILAEIIAQLKKKNGKIAIPHFYDKVIKLRKKERDILSHLPISDEKLLQNVKCLGLSGEKGYTNLERLWCRPTLDVHGFVSGYIGSEAKTIIPAKAIAIMSMRLVPDQQPDEILNFLDSYVQSIAPPIVTVKIRKLHGSLSYITPFNHAALQIAKKAFEKAFGKKAVFIREGGSIPFVPMIASIFEKPCILMGLGLPDDGAHAPNEKLSLHNFYHGILAMIYLYQDLASLK